MTYKDNESNRPINTTMLSFEEACEYLKISKSFLYKLTSNRSIPFYKPTGGKIIRFNREDLDQWLLQNRHASKNELATIKIK